LLNICYVGCFGIGKTHLLKKLSKEFKTIVLSSNPLLGELETIALKKFKSKKQAYYYLQRTNKKVLIFDDLHEARKDTVSNILKLCKKHTIICASETEIERLRFDFKIVKMKKMSQDESMQLCKSLCKDEKVCQEICRQAKGLPLLIVRGVEHYKVTGTIKRYYSTNWKKLFVKRVSIMAYLFLSLRYLARVNNNWEVYSLLSTIAYALLALNRFNKRL
jgi:hypothetical protein